MTIKDKLIDPYEIHPNEAGGYVLKEKVISNNEETGEEKEYFKVIGYFTSVKSSLEKIIELIVKQKKDVLTLREYIEEVKTLNFEFEYLLSTKI